MKKRLWALWRRLARDIRGTEIVEGAFVIPLAFMFIMGIFWFGLAFLIYGTLAQGTRAGAEAAVAPVCTTCAAGGTPATIAQTAVYNALAAAHLSKNNLVATGGWTPPMLCACGSVATRAACTAALALACDNTVTDVCVQVKVQLSFPTQGGAGTCGTSVSARYRYPFHMGIPLTGLDIGNVLLPGQAQMRAESQ
ncbi:MAG: TadE/TadG family type IV pilus assembly protein [Candidatus Sulfotelmatobacter sp.]